MIQPDMLIELVDRLSKFFFVAKRYGDALHDNIGLTTGERALLTSISAGGETVPRLADARSISRQAIQKTVDLLEAKGLIRKVAPETDRRSRLLETTAEGRRLLERVRQRDRLAAAMPVTGLSAADLAATGRVLDALEAELARRTEDLKP